jgi:hypothetical protein
MSLRKPLMELPAAFEANRRHRMATNEARQPTMGNSADSISIVVLGELNAPFGRPRSCGLHEILRWKPRYV